MSRPLSFVAHTLHASPAAAAEHWRRINLQRMWKMWRTARERVSCRSLNRIAKAKHRDCVWFSGHTHFYSLSINSTSHTHFAQCSVQWVLEQQQQKRKAQIHAKSGGKICARRSLPAKSKNSRVKWRAVLSFGKASSDTPSKAKHNLRVYVLNQSIIISVSWWSAQVDQNDQHQQHRLQQSLTTHLKSHVTRKHRETVCVWEFERGLKAKDRGSLCSLVTVKEMEMEPVFQKNTARQAGHFSQLCVRVPRRAGQ